MTIDLGFAWTALPSGAAVAFVDVPGHERFVTNMLAGVGPVPAVLPPALARGWTVPPARVPALGADTDAVRRELATESPAGGPPR